MAKRKIPPVSAPKSTQKPSEPPLRPIKPPKDEQFRIPEPTEAYLQVAEEQAAQELMRRQRARDSLQEYARAVDIPGTPAAKTEEDDEIFDPVETGMALHHRIMLNAIQKTIETPNGRLMIFAPPGSAKSSYTSVVTPSWCLAKWKGYQIILASYGQKIAEKQSRKTRALCRSEKHVSIWEDRPILSADQKAIGEWSLSNGSGFMAVGIMGGVTGSRADGLLIDDPVAGREEADSETIRKKTKEEYEDSLVTRLKPNGWIILVQTRWHEDDLAGGILPEDYQGQSGPIMCRDGQVWTVLNIPAEAEHADDPLGRKPGEFLWPEWFPETHWLIRKNNPQGQRSWAALCQQRPTALDGIEFQRDWFVRYDPDLAPGSPGGRPANLTMYGASDYATKDDRAADFSEHGIMGVSPEWDLVLVDWWFGQKTTDVTLTYMVGMVRRWRPRKWWDEGNVIGNAIAPARTRAMREAKPPVHVTCEAMTSIKSKALKLASFQAHAAAGKVWFPKNRAWADRVIAQLCAFPAGRYDDAADVCGLFGRAVDQMMTSNPEPPEPELILKPFSATWLEWEEDDRHELRWT